MKCPDCNSENVTGPDFEGLIDCLNCGTWFTPSDQEGETTAEVKAEETQENTVLPKTLRLI